MNNKFLIVDNNGCYVMSFNITHEISIMSTTTKINHAQYFDYDIVGKVLSILEIAFGSEKKYFNMLIVNNNEH